MVKKIANGTTASTGIKGPLRWVLAIAVIIFGLLLLGLILYGIYRWWFGSSVKEGSFCKSQEDCGKGMLCQQEACITPKGEGESCEIGLQCQGNLSCQNNICSPPPTSTPSGPTTTTPEFALPTPRGICGVKPEEGCVLDQGLYYKPCPEGYRGQGPLCYKN